MIVSRPDIASAVASAGVTDRDTVLVHASLSALGYVPGGAEAAVLALLDVVGSHGTIAAPAQSWLNLDPETGVHRRPAEEWQAIRDALPGFERATTPSVGMGAVAEAIRTWPGAERSDHPVRSWAAIGEGAGTLTAHHDLEDVHGEASPLGAAMRRNARVLLLGVPYAKCTALHLAETLAAIPKRYETITTWRRGPAGREQLTFRNQVFDDVEFDEIGAAFEAHEDTPVISLGSAQVRAPRLRALVSFAMRRMESTR